MKPIDRSPARLSRWISFVAALVALVSSGLYSWPALATGTLGLGLLGVGLARGSTTGVTVGAFGLFVGAILAGAQGAPVVPALIGVTFAVLAWDLGGSAISIGDQLGRDADTVRLEAVHMTGSTAVGAVTAGVGFGLYQAGNGGQPVAALVFLVIAAVLLVAALD